MLLPEGKGLLPEGKGLTTLPLIRDRRSSAESRTVVSSSRSRGSRSLIVLASNQGKSGTMVSLVGPGRSYQGFGGKSGPTRVLSYQGLLSPTRVFGRPQADPRLSYQGF